MGAAAAAAAAATAAATAAVWPLGATLAVPARAAAAAAAAAADAAVAVEHDERPTVARIREEHPDVEPSVEGASLDVLVDLVDLGGEMGEVS